MSGQTTSDLQRIAVLFTDVVGSTKYFQTYGDVAGRTMLQQHQDLASRPIVEHGGVLVKTLGDSIMAYFSDPMESVKSAIKIQDEFSELNRELASEKQIHVKIAIHYGDGIVEKEDIFGSVVNLAAKITTTLVGDEVLISQDLYEQVQGMPLVGFDPVDLGDKRRDLDGLSLYRITWDEDVTFDPTTNLLLYLRPLWRMSNAQFKRAWERLSEERHSMWDAEVEQARVVTDQGIAVILKNAPLVLDLACNLLAFFRDNSKAGEGFTLTPLHIVIDSGAFLRAGQLVLDSLEMAWDEIDPGSIHISSSACRFVSGKCRLTTDPPFDNDRHQVLYRLIPEGAGEDKTSPLFLYQDVLVRGYHPPCYYCGNRRHRATDCPSKSLSNAAGASGQLGYRSLDTINKLYYRSLMGESSADDAGADLASEPASTNTLALNGFYELSRIHQLRFFRTIWDAGSDDWESLQYGDDGEDKGGMTWMATDCIRVSNLAEAESILGKCLEQAPTDYKVHCAAAFLHIEKNDLHQAMVCFSQALRDAEKRTQKVFILFQIARIFALQGNPADEEKAIADILARHPHCPEAAFRRIILRYRRGLKEEARKDLETLIESHREFFVHALIHPDLAPYNRDVHRQLERIYGYAKGEAERSLQRAERELERVRCQIEGEEEDVAKAESLWSNCRHAMRSDGYFGYLDAARQGGTVVSLCLRTLEKQRMRVRAGLSGLRKRCEEHLSTVADYPYRSLLGNVRRRLKWIQGEINRGDDGMRAETPGVFVEILGSIEKISSEMDLVGLSLVRLERVRKACLFLGILLKRGLLYQSINFALGIILLPVLAHYLISVFPQFKHLYQNLWTYQIGFLFYVGIFVFLLTVRLAIKEVSDR